MYEYRVMGHDGWGPSVGQSNHWSYLEARQRATLRFILTARWLGAESGDQDNANFTLLMLLSNTNNITKYKRCSR